MNDKEGKIVDIARSAQKAFRDNGLYAAIGKLKSIQNLVMGGPLSGICESVDLLIKDLKKYKGQGAINHIETFIDTVCSRCDHEGGMI